MRSLFPTTTDPFTRDDLKHVGVAVGILLLTVLISRLASYRMRNTLERGGFQVNVAILLVRTLWISIWALGILMALYQVGGSLTPLAALIGVVGLAASLALQQVLQNLVAGVYLLAERPFNIGDIIAVVGPSGLNHEGTVQDIQMRTTHLRSRDDELILVPNSAIFSGVVTNRTAVGGYVTQVDVTFPRQTDPLPTRQRMQMLLADLPAVLSAPTPGLRVEKADANTWTARVLFWIRSAEGRSEAIWAIANAFPEATVNTSEPAV